MYQPHQEYDHSYLSQWNNRNYEVPTVHTALTQRENPYHVPEPNAYDLYLQNQAYPNMYGTLAQNQHPRIAHNEHFVAERDGEWHSDLEQYAQMEPVPAKDMARFA